MTSNDTLMAMLHDAGGFDPDIDYDLKGIKARAVRQKSRARALKTVGGAAVGVSAISSIVYLTIPGHNAGKPARVAQLGGAECGVASVTPIGGAQQVNGKAVLASGRAGSPVTVGATLHLIKTAAMLDMQLIVGTPDSTPGVGGSAELPQTAVQRAKKQIAANTAHSPTTDDQITVTTPPLASGFYPVYYLLRFVDAPGCTAGPGIPAEEMGRLGFIDVTP